MRKLLLFGALLCALCSCGSGNSNSHVGHEWVDLGLPSGLKWATCNVGASSPGDYGDYFAWGETESNDNYDNCISSGKLWDDIAGDSSRDAARANWGGSWRMPTKDEFQELIDNCTCTWTTQNGHKGYKLISRKNGNSIFLPAAGYRRGGVLYDDGKLGFYRSSTPNKGRTDFAFSLYFFEGTRGVNWRYRYLGHSVRPVLED